MWDLTLDELLSLGFIGNKVYNICSKVGLNTLYCINEFSKTRTFTKIENCGHTTDTQLRSLCENYRRAIKVLSNPAETPHLITAETTIEELLETERIILLTYKTCSGSGCETVEDIANKINVHSILKRARPSVRKELISVCEEAENNRLIRSLRYYDKTETDYIIPETGHSTEASHALTEDITIHTLFDVGRMSIRAYHCCKNMELYTLRSIVQFRDRGLPHFYTVRGCGRKTVNELCELCDEYKSLFGPVESIEDPQIEESNPTSIEPTKEDSETAKEYFTLEFKRLKARLSVRGRHLCEETWKTYLDMLPFLEYPYDSFSKRFAGKKKSSKELYDMLREFRSIYLSNIEISEEELSRINHERLFPFLIDRELDFVLSFKAEYGRYPMLYILTAYLSLSSDRRDGLYSYKFGILTGEPHNNDEVAAAYFLTRERVRQLVQKYHLNKALEFARIPDWNYYIQNAPLVLSKESSFYHEIAKQEKLENGYSAFVGLLGTVVSYRKIRRKGERIYVKEEYEAKARIILDKLSEILYARYARDIRISLPSIVGKNPAHISIARTFLDIVFHIAVEEDNCFEIKQSKVDVCLELIEILDVIGYPVTLDELFMFFKDKYPEHKYEESAQLRPSVLSSDDIVAIGKSGMYGLKKWNIFTGSVRDCAYMILSQSTEPMPDELLVEKLLEYFPNSNYKSLMSSLVSDPKERFAHYTDSTTWLIEYSHRTNKTLVKSRMSFDNRLDDLKTFLETYRRWPFASGGDDEASLARWIYNHTRREVLPGYDPVEARHIEQLQEEYSHYPHNNSEYEFQNTCADFRIFLERNYRLPEANSDTLRETELAHWFDKALTKKEPYADNRQLYFEELLSYLRDYGFSI